MIHVDDVEICLTAQRKLRAAALEGGCIESYYENLGVCPDCLVTGIGWFLVLVLSELPHPPRNPEEGTIALEQAFVQGFSTGIILGREHAP